MAAKCDRVSKSCSAPSATESVSHGGINDIKQRAAAETHEGGGGAVEDSGMMRFMYERLIHKSVLQRQPQRLSLGNDFTKSSQRQKKYDQIFFIVPFIIGFHLSLLKQKNLAQVIKAL